MKGITQHVFIRNLNKYPIPTKEEVCKLLDLLEDGTSLKLAISILLFCGLRPSEVANLRWNWLNWDSGRLISIKHLIYKPVNRMNQSSITTIFKMIEKPVSSPYLERQFILYAKRAPKYKDGRIFPFTTNDSLNKWFSHVRTKIRKKSIKDADFMLESVLEPVTIASHSQYKITPYSLRRFCLTFLFWTVFMKAAKGSRDGAALLLSRHYSGHSRPETLLNHYILPFESIGLSKDDIGEEIPIDDFIQALPRGQTRLIDWSFLDGVSVLTIDPGQRRIDEFA